MVREDPKELVEEALVRGDVNVLISYSTDWLQKEPRNVIAQYLLGFGYYLNEEYEKQSKFIAEIYQEEASIDLVLQFAEELVAKNPRSLYILMLRGDCLLMKGRKVYENALKSFEEVLSMDEKNIVALNGKSYALRGYGNLMAALRVCDELIKLEPNFASAYNNKGNILRSLGRYEEAIQCYDKAIQINSEYPFAWINMAVVLETLKCDALGYECRAKASGLKKLVEKSGYFKGLKS